MSHCHPKSDKCDNRAGDPALVYGHHHGVLPENSTVLGRQQVKLSLVSYFLFHFESELELLSTPGDSPTSYLP